MYSATHRQYKNRQHTDSQQWNVYEPYKKNVESKKKFMARAYPAFHVAYVSFLLFIDLFLEYLLQL